MAVDPQAVQSGMDIFNSAYLHSQLFWTGLSFALMLGTLWWKVVPTITKMLDERANKIAGDLGRAETARTDAEKALSQYEAKLAKAKDEATAILATARTDAKKMVDAKIAEADADIGKKKEEAKTAIANAKNQAMGELETTVAKLAVKISEELIEKTVDAKQAQELTDTALKQLQ